MLSNCGSDEYGGAYGGQAGDQTGREWRLIPWYYGSWTHVFRHPDPRVGPLVARLAIQAALNDLIGYDQSQRLTFWYRLQIANFDPSQIKTACESDCSAGVAAIVKAVGNLLGIEPLKRLPETMSTWVEVDTLKAAGFEILTASKYLTSETRLQPGDILLKYGHTCTEVGSGRLSDFPLEVDMPLTDQEKRDIANLVAETLPAKVWEYHYNGDGSPDNQYNRLASVVGGVAVLRDNVDNIRNRLAPTLPVMPFGGPVYRLSSPSGAHTWTNSPDQRTSLMALGWNDEGVAFELGEAGEEIRLLVHPENHEAILTTSFNEAVNLANHNWQYMGVIGTAGDGEEVHRLRNDASGFHMLTTDANEVKALVKLGWVDEGVAFRSA